MEDEMGETSSMCGGNELFYRILIGKSHLRCIEKLHGRITLRGILSKLATNFLTAELF
jgi:hypothetical protein